MVLVQPVRPLSSDRHGVQRGANVRSPRPCIPSPRLRRPSPSRNAPDFHGSFPRRTERQGHPCHSSTRYCSANKRGWCIPGCSACSWSSASNAITLAGVRQRHGETYGDWQSSGVLAEYLDESRCDDVLIRSSHVVAGDAPNEPWHRRYPSLMPANSLPVIRRHRRTRPGSRPRKATT
jgi:hypothetical protein